MTKARNQRNQRVTICVLQWSVTLTSDEGACSLVGLSLRRLWLQWSVTLTSDEGTVTADDTNESLKLASMERHSHE